MPQALQNPGLAPDVKSASPVVNASGVKLVSGGSSYEPSSFIGTTPSYLSAHSYEHRRREPRSPTPT